MVSSKLTNEQIVQIAQQTIDESTELDDATIFMMEHKIVSGGYSITCPLFYKYYCHFSTNPLEYSEFCVKLEDVLYDALFKVKKECLDMEILERIILSEAKEKVKKKRSGQVSSFKPKIKR